jgi:gamma-glutamyltranspeptidase
MLSEQPTLATQGMVATAHYLTTQAGLHRLQQGVTSYMALGSTGGDAQPQIHVQLLSAMIDFALHIQQAISAPRWHMIPTVMASRLAGSRYLWLEFHVARKDISYDYSSLSS